jgi:hypothetical protein
VAVFPDSKSAQQAEQALQKTGVGPEEAIAVGAGEVKEFAAEHVERNGLFGLLMSKISDAIGTEQTYQNYDLDSADGGAGFVAVKCPSEEIKQRVWQVLRGLHPLNARYYAPGGIEHLTGEV